MERPVDKQLLSQLLEGAQAVGQEVDESTAVTLLRYQALLLEWNRKVNLTAITQPREVVEKHLVDSLAAATVLEGRERVVDLGAGGGFPGVPLAIVYPEASFTLVDAVAKKVGFLKAAIASLGLRNCRAVHVRAEGNPEKEGIGVADAAICRAFLALPEWLELAPDYVVPGGRVLAMLGPEAQRVSTPPHGLVEESWREYALPSGARRALAAYCKP